ncbi:MAG: hypothetical protein ABR954_10240 [Dehalococcoidales bacterium]
MNNWALSDFVVSKLIPFTGTTPFPLNELLLMSGALLRFQPDHLFEWGTHIGKSARIFYETVRTFNIHCTIHTIELPDEVAHVEHPGRQYAVLIRNMPQIRKYRGDGLEESFRIARSMHTKTRFMFFLDGDHSYTSVHRELDAIVHKFPLACIILHDTFFQSADSGYNIGPYQAIETALKSNSEKYQVIHTATGLPGMTLLYPRR